MRILIVDDSPTALLQLRLKLEGLGHEVVQVRDGREAWEHLRARPERLVITNWMMPNLDGPDLCRQIRAAGGDDYIYVILLTMKDLHKDQIEGLQAGADDFLMKPVDAVELETALEAAGRILAVLDRLRGRVAELERENERLAGLLATRHDRSTSLDGTTAPA
jgi:DNA-binding response OmpR family regulator